MQKSTAYVNKDLTQSCSTLCFASVAFASVAQRIFKARKPLSKLSENTLENRISVPVSSTQL
ncbi:hypothetical protein [Neisseria zoodegmatis]|uniref:hypothetical protein n=1 Tax=Neisseria zoodegmatis TaxID=326523 RepID=UPI0012FD34CC|nr:hypothetical protein [Neisseria zoodegmatis]